MAETVYNFAEMKKEKIQSFNGAFISKTFFIDHQV